MGWESEAQQSRHKLYTFQPNCVKRMNNIMKGNYKTNDLCSGVNMCLLLCFRNEMIYYCVTVFMSLEVVNDYERSGDLKISYRINS